MALADETIHSSVLQQWGRLARYLDEVGAPDYMRGNVRSLEHNLPAEGLAEFDRGYVDAALMDCPPLAGALVTPLQES